MLDDTLLPSKKIAAISLMGDRRVIAVSAYHDGVLAIASMEELGGIFQSWRKALAEKLSKYQQAGLSIIIETDNDYFDDAGLCIRLDQLDDTEARTYQNIALDRYFALLALGDIKSESKGERRGNIRMPSVLQRHWLNTNSINIKQDEKGRSRYDIEDSKIGGYQRALLLSVLGAVHFNQYDVNSLSELMGMVGNPVQQPSAFDRLNNILRGIYGESP